MPPGGAAPALAAGAAPGGAAGGSAVVDGGRPGLAGLRDGDRVRLRDGRHGTLYDASVKDGCVCVLVGMGRRAVVWPIAVEDVEPFGELAPAPSSVAAGGGR